MADNCGDQIKVATLKVVSYKDCFARLKLKPVDPDYLSGLKLAAIVRPHLVFDHVGGSSKDIWVDFNEDVYGDYDLNLKHVMHFLDLLQCQNPPFYLANTLGTTQLKSRLFDCELTQIKLSLYSTGNMKNWDYPVLTLPNRIMVSVDYDNGLNIGVWLQGPHLSSENKARVFEKYSRAFYSMDESNQNHYFDNDTISFNLPDKSLDYLGVILSTLSSISPNVTTQFSTGYKGPRIGNNQSDLVEDFDHTDEPSNTGYVNFFFDGFI